MDLQVEVAPVTYMEMMGAASEGSAAVAARVLAARERQVQRKVETGVALNAELDARRVREIASPDREGAALVRGAMERWGLSARGHDRVLRVARTLADLDAGAEVRACHIAEALQFRSRYVSE
jgi:magnesium chelatase family protein